MKMLLPGRPQRSLDATRAAVTSRGRFTMAVSGGRTAWLMLRTLSAGELPWRQVHVFQVDEHLVPRGDPDRNFAHLGASLLDHAPLSPDHIHAMPVEAASLIALPNDMGGEKAEAIVRLRDPDWSIPTSRVRQNGARLLADRAAAARLGSEEQLEA
jgi:hypothetical protein